MEKRLNSLPSQGNIHGFESRLGHHTKNYSIDKKQYCFLFSLVFLCDIKHYNVFWPFDSANKNNTSTVFELWSVPNLRKKSMQTIKSL